MVGLGNTALKQMMVLLRNDLRSSIPDPLGRGSGFVMTSYPQRLVESLPVIICETELEGEEFYGNQSSDGFQTTMQTIRVYSHSMKELDVLTDKIITRLNSLRDIASSSPLFIYDVRIVQAFDTFKDEGKMRIFIKNIEFESKTLREVS